MQGQPTSEWPEVERHDEKRRNDVHLHVVSQVPRRQRALRRERNYSLLILGKITCLQGSGAKRS